MTQTQNEPGLESLNRTASFLRGRANRYAWFGLGVALAALLAANLLACRAEYDEYSFQGMIQVQQINPALWLLDVMPLLFLIWGQYIGAVMSYQAGAMVMDETRALREQASLLEYQLGHAPVHGQAIGLPNRHAFAGEINKAIARRKRHGGVFAVLILDTEQYHEVEQGQGEDAAHEFASQLSYRLKNAIGDSDFLAHFSYDDFAVLMPQVREEADPRRLASRIQLALDTPLFIRRAPMSVRSSIGIALYPTHGEDAETLIRCAETAKYAAAAEYRDYLIYEPDIENARTERPRLIAELHAVLSHEGLAEEYQPQMPLKPGLPPRLRLLPYWPHPRRGRLEQNEFLNLPDRASLVQSLSLWLLGESAARLAVWRREVHAQLGMVVRLPDATLTQSQSSIVDTVMRLLRSYDLPGSAFTLEFSEKALSAGDEQARQELLALRGEGVNVCLMGVGHLGASPATALYYPVNQARFAPELVYKAQDQAAALNVLSNFAALLDQLVQNVVVSGADSAGSMKLANTLSAHYAEGAAISKPLKPDDIGRWVASLQTL